MNVHAENLRQAIQTHHAKVALVGLGYVGLPLATGIAEGGFQVTGIDLDPNRVAKVNRGDSYIEDVPSARLGKLVRDGKLKAHEDFLPVQTSDVIIVCVPTPLDKSRTPDTSYIESAVEKALPYLHAGQLLIMESTSYPGTLEDLVAVPLTKAGLKPGEEVLLVYSSERIDPGNQSHHLQNVPKVIGGLTPQSTELACLFYQQALHVATCPVSSPSVAEMSKLLENTFRSVNVSMINELAQLCDRMGIDIWEAIGAADTKPFGFKAFYPGPGVGGHCIPIDPVYLSWKARQYGFTPRFIELAGEVNDTMPNYVVTQAMEVLNSRGKAMKGSSILVLGVAYKRDVADTRESAALQIIELVQERGGRVKYHDPFVPELRIGTQNLHSVPLTADALRSSDLVVITTDHSEVDYKLVSLHASLVYDTRNAMKAFPGPNVRLLGAPSHSGNDHGAKPETWSS